MARTVLLGVLGPKSATPPGLLANELRAPLGGECHGRVQRPRSDRDLSLPQDSTLPYERDAGLQAPAWRTAPPASAQRLGPRRSGGRRAEGLEKLPENLL